MIWSCYSLPLYLIAQKKNKHTQTHRRRKRRRTWLWIWIGSDDDDDDDNMRLEKWSGRRKKIKFNNLLLPLIIIIIHWNKIFLVSRSIWEKKCYVTCIIYFLFFSLSLLIVNATQYFKNINKWRSFFFPIHVQNVVSYMNKKWYWFFSYPYTRSFVR